MLSDRPRGLDQRGTHAGTHAGVTKNLTRGWGWREMDGVKDGREMVEPSYGLDVGVREGGAI